MHVTIANLLCARSLDRQEKGTPLGSPEAPHTSRVGPYAKTLPWLRGNHQHYQPACRLPLSSSPCQTITLAFTVPHSRAAAVLCCAVQGPADGISAHCQQPNSSTSQALTPAGSACAPLWKSRTRSAQLQGHSQATLPYPARPAQRPTRRGFNATTGNAHDVTNTKKSSVHLNRAQQQHAHPRTWLLHTQESCAPAGITYWLPTPLPHHSQQAKPAYAAHSQQATLEDAHMPHSRMQLARSLGNRLSYAPTAHQLASFCMRPTPTQETDTQRARRATGASPLATVQHTLRTRTRTHSSAVLLLHSEQRVKHTHMHEACRNPCNAYSLLTAVLRLAQMLCPAGAAAVTAAALAPQALVTAASFASPASAQGRRPGPAGC